MSVPKLQITDQLARLAIASTHQPGRRWFAFGLVARRSPVIQSVTLDAPAIVSLGSQLIRERRFTAGPAATC